MVQNLQPELDPPYAQDGSRDDSCQFSSDLHTLTWHTGMHAHTCTYTQTDSQTHTQQHRIIFLKKASMSVLGTSLKECISHHATLYHRDTRAATFSTAIITAAKSQYQPRHSSTGKRRKKWGAYIQRSCIQLYFLKKWKIGSRAGK